MFKPILAIAAAALSTATLFASPAAYAADPQAQVAWGDLDLSTASGRKELSHRVDAAARAVCPSQVTTGSRIDQNLSCRRDVASQIAGRINAKSHDGLGG